MAADPSPIAQPEQGQVTLWDKLAELLKQSEDYPSALLIVSGSTPDGSKISVCVARGPAASALEDWVRRMQTLLEELQRQVKVAEA